MLILTAAFCGSNGCSQTMPDRAERLTRGYVYYLDGAGGGATLSNWAGGVRDGLLAAGYNGAGEMFTWNTGGGVVADQDATVEYKRRKAGELAAQIDRYTKDHPSAPVTLMGLSAGTAVAVFTLEAMPAGCQVDNVVLLGASIGADYDLSRALRHVRNKVYVFTSEKDGVLAFLVPMAGTADRTLSPAAGLRGFQVPPGATTETRALYAKVAHIGWRPEFARAGDFGGHTDTVKAPFVKQYIAPLIMASAARAEPSTAGAAGLVANPDYRRWSQVAPGSSITFEGYQLVGGEKQPMLVTARLVSKHENRLIVERSYIHRGTDEPARVQQFIAVASIHPDDHPMTHRGATIRELPREKVVIGSKVFDCRVQSIDAPGSFAEWGRDVNATVYRSDEIPGGIAKLSLRAMKDGQPYEFVGQVVRATNQ